MSEKAFTKIKADLDAHQFVLTAKQNEKDKSYFNFVISLKPALEDKAEPTAQSGLGMH